MGQKRIILVIVAAIVILAGGFWVFQKSDDKKTASVSDSISVSIKKQLADAPDSDLDGLKDWEETLWGTDPQNSDTDDDETHDGEEIKLGRNPLIPNTAPEGERSNDFLTDTLPESDAGSEKLSADNEALTSVIAREAFQNFIEQVNLGANEEGAQQQIAAYLTNNLQNQINASGRIIDEFTINDIKISADSSKEAIKNYINTVGKITIEDVEKTQGNELILLTRLVEEANARESRKKFGEFENYVSAYNSSRTKMVSLAVPKNYAQYHLSLINVLNNMSKINKTFVDFMLDPVKGVLAIKSYSNEAIKLVVTLKDTESRLSLDGVNIGPQDEGYVLFQ